MLQNKPIFNYFLKYNNFRNFTLLTKNKTVMKHPLILLFLFALFISTISCKKQEEPPVTPSNSTTPALTLEADKKTISLGEQAVITATTSYTNPSFTWSVNTSSSIVGSGSQVKLYASCPSCTGPNEVTCTVKDGSNTTSAKITISVQ